MPLLSPLKASIIYLLSDIEHVHRTPCMTTGHLSHLRCFLYHTRRLRVPCKACYLCRMPSPTYQHLHPQARACRNQSIGTSCTCTMSLIIDHGEPCGPGQATHPAQCSCSRTTEHFVAYQQGQLLSHLVPSHLAMDASTTKASIP